MLEPIVKKLIVEGEALLANFSQYVSTVENNTHTTYENRKASLNGTAYRVQTADVVLNFPGMLGLHPTLPRKGMLFVNVEAPSPIQSNDVVYEITYTPNDADHDPNYNNGNPVTILIGEHERSGCQRNVVHQRDQRCLGDPSHRAQQRDNDGVWAHVGCGHRLHVGKHRQVLAERPYRKETPVRSPEYFFFPIQSKMRSFRADLLRKESDRGEKNIPWRRRFNRLLAGGENSWRRGNGPHGVLPGATFELGRGTKKC